MRNRLEQIYETLERSYGPQHWWPADGPFEVMVGAVLTQNTAWGNVERAIDNLKQAECLSLDAVMAMPKRELAAMIRPAGYFNVKADRLRKLCAWLSHSGGVDAVRCWPTATLREALLQVHGIGPETADDILLYAFDRPVFVIDAYTRRIFSRVALVDGAEPYEILRKAVEEALDSSAPLYSEYHALLVRHAKTVCRRQPQCRACCIRAMCVFGHQAPGAKGREAGRGPARGVTATRGGTTCVSP